MMRKAYVFSLHPKYDFESIQAEIVPLVEKGDNRPSIGDPTSLASFILDMLVGKEFDPAQDGLIISGHSVAISLLVAVAVKKFTLPIRLLVYSTTRYRYEEKVLSHYE